MSDRFVEQIRPELNENSRQKRFSEFSDAPDLILLGDPGAGKTHLFRETSRAVGGRYVRARDFLNGPVITGCSTLFIDALDEKRAGRGDRDTIDAVVRKLFETDAAQVRIACRIADWLGDSDLAAFQPYFAARGQVAVVSLRALSEEEQLSLLESRNVADPPAFRAEALRRGIEGFLGNPQTLIMLADVVAGSSWPSTRVDLFNRTAQLLLTESNEERARSGIGSRSATDLLDVTGAICAVRLISDVSGISLRESDTNTDYPTYRSLNGFEPEIVQAALSRRVFEATGEMEAVDYNHRTVAEFLAARWLANRVRAGFSLRRLRALLGVAGHPASELRGLHAWLPVMLPERADELIKADPYGVLTYGDGGSLSFTS